MRREGFLPKGFSRIEEGRQAQDARIRGLAYEWLVSLMLDRDKLVRESRFSQIVKASVEKGDVLMFDWDPDWYDGAFSTNV